MTDNDAWEERFAKPIRKSAVPHAMTFVEFLIERCKGHPEMIPVFAGAMADMGQWYHAQVAGLDGLVELRQITAAHKEGGGL